jgi:RNA polymerase sigma-70 factor (ECF subfamily)
MRSPSPASCAARADDPSSAAGAGVATAAADPPDGKSPGLRDSDLVAALGRGEPWAAEEVWDRYAASVRRLMGRALGPRPEVEDLTQEAFMRVFSRIGTLREANALREFVLVIAVNVLKRELRHRWVRRRVLLSDSGSVPDVEGPSSDPEAREALARCYAILDKLGARERAAFVLRYMEERTLDEVAAALDVSLSTAKRLVIRSAERINKHVGSDAGLRDFFDQRQPPSDAGQASAGPPTNTSAKANVSR